MTVLDILTYQYKWQIHGLRFGDEFLLYKEFKIYQTPAHHIAGKGLYIEFKNNWYKIHELNPLFNGTPFESACYDVYDSDQPPELAAYRLNLRSCELVDEHMGKCYSVPPRYAKQARSIKLPTVGDI